MPDWQMRWHHHVSIMTGLKRWWILFLVDVKSYLKPCLLPDCSRVRPGAQLWVQLLPYLYTFLHYSHEFKKKTNSPHTSNKPNSEEHQWKSPFVLPVKLSFFFLSIVGFLQAELDGCLKLIFGKSWTNTNQTYGWPTLKNTRSMRYHRWKTHDIQTSTSLEVFMSVLQLKLPPNGK